MSEVPRAGETIAGDWSGIAVQRVGFLYHRLPQTGLQGSSQQRERRSDDRVIVEELNPSSAINREQNKQE
jgi:hypothetical protein